MTKTDATVEIERLCYTVEQAAAALGINSDRMGGLVRLGRVPHIQLGQRILVGKRALEQWLTNECLSNAQIADDEVSLSSITPMPAPRGARKSRA